MICEMVNVKSHHTNMIRRGVSSECARLAHVALNASRDETRRLNKRKKGKKDKEMAKYRRA